MFLCSQRCSCRVVAVKKDPYAAPSTATLHRYSYPLTVASTARHVVDQSAKPFLLVGDAAWSLFAALSDADAEFYLENRKQHGFTAVLANLLEKKYAPNAPANFYGFTPFTGKPFTTPREDYFAHVDYHCEVGRRERALPCSYSHCSSAISAAVTMAVGVVRYKHATLLGDEGMGRVCRQPVPELRQYRLGDRWGYGPNPC